MRRPDVSLRDGRILLVGDDAAALLTLTDALAESQIQVSTTADPRQVAELLHAGRPDVVVVDLGLPYDAGERVISVVAGAPEGPDVPVLVLTKDDTVDSKRLAIARGADDFLTKPVDPAEAALRVSNLLRTRLLQTELKRQNERLEEKVRRRTEDLWGLVRRLEQTEHDLERSQAETIRRLATAAEFRDDETGRHVLRMSRYCGVLAGECGMDSETVRSIVTASQMHDVGKIGTPDRILLKPSKLSTEERVVMERHTTDGWRILEGSSSPLLQLAAVIALTHHERPDGTGYPNGLGRGEIPPEGRIAAIADVFDALSTNRIYRPALPLPDVWRIMHEGRGTKFDADLLDLFIESMDSVLQILESYGDRPVP